MMSDMHDGTGGQLVSALSLVEGGDFRNEDLAETLRAALADLRLSIDSLETGPPDLLALLALARTRLGASVHGRPFRPRSRTCRHRGFGPEKCCTCCASSRKPTNAEARLAPRRSWSAPDGH
jgi:hypothetical protein